MGPAMASARFLPAATADPPEVSRSRWTYVESRDGTAIGWCRNDPPGEDPGRLPVVLCNGIACSVGYWTTLAHRLRRERPVVQWDYRGHGVSGVPAIVDAVTIDDVMADLDAVMRAASAAPAVLVGHSFGVQVALEAARRWPQRVAAIVAIAGSPGAPLPPGATRPYGLLSMVERAFERQPQRADEAWQAWWRSPLMHVAARALGGTSLAAPRQMMLAYYDHVSTRHVPLLLAMMRSMQDHDASDVVPALQVPLLALAGDADRLTPLPVMTRLALDAPHGELAVCHGGTHTLPAEHPWWVLDQIRPLLRRVDTTARHVDLPAGA
jgi:pimeloyl-ACP methyl ester carboxylesterase